MALIKEPGVRRHSYAALEGPEHIRLIALQPALSKDAPLRINFLSSTLEDLEGNYEAISYTWGQPLLTFALHVDDGTQVCVTENLDRALRYLRHNDRDRLLWADAACINQIDNAEKAVQIPLMVDIFRGAQRVMAWLDPGGDTAVEQRGMQIVKRLSRPSKMRHSIWVEGCRELSCFINLPWFNRLWIVQEVVFSVEVLLICGDTEITFPRFIAALSFIQEEASPLESDDRARVDAIAKIGRLWSSHSLFGTQPMRSPQSSDDERHSNSNDMLSLVETFALYACTDPRDRLFALLSMAANAQPAGFVSKAIASSKSQKKGVVSLNMDYSLNVLETYRLFAISCWTTRPAGMWEALFLRQHSSPPDDWPSWVPDWRVVPKETLPVDMNEFRIYFRPRSVWRSGVRVHTYRYRRVLSEDDAQPYTVRSNVPREYLGSEPSFESQLLQLCINLNGSEPARTPDPLADTSQPVSQALDTIQLPNFLYETIGSRVLGISFLSGRRGDESHHHGDFLQKLVEYFWSEMLHFDGYAPRHRPTSTSSRDQYGTSKDTGNLFVFHDASTQVNSIGYGDVAPEIGDHIVPVGDVETRRLYGGTMAVIILRPADPLEQPIDHGPTYFGGWSDNGVQTYRLVGSGCIFDPTCVLLKWATRGRSFDAQFKPEFFAALGCQIFDQEFELV